MIMIYSYKDFIHSWERLFFLFQTIQPNPELISWYVLWYHSTRWTIWHDNHMLWIPIIHRIRYQDTISIWWYQYMLIISIYDIDLIMSIHVDNINTRYQLIIAIHEYQLMISIHVDNINTPWEYSNTWISIDDINTCW